MVLRVILPLCAVKRIVDDLALEACGDERMFIGKPRYLKEPRHDGTDQIDALKLDLDVILARPALLLTHKLGVRAKILVLELGYVSRNGLVVNKKLGILVHMFVAQGRSSGPASAKSR